MNDNIRSLLTQINTLEDELRTELHQQESRMLFEIKGKHVEFEQAVKLAHRRLKQNLFRWRVTNRPWNLITEPIIYGIYNKIRHELLR